MIPLFITTDLLARSTHSTSSPYPMNGHAFYHADGNGNITALVNASGVLQANYRYDPFGRTLSSSGTLANGNTLRFSSKPVVVTPYSQFGMYYYGYRFYDPLTQRWLNRDPIEEDGGLNLTAFVFNTPVDFVDIDGQMLGLFRNNPRFHKAVFIAYLSLRGLLPGSGLPNVARDLLRKQGYEQVTRSLNAANNKTQRRGQGRGSGGTSMLAIGFLVVYLESIGESLLAAESVLTGNAGTDGEITHLESFYINKLHGNDAHADMDALTAALENNGMEAWATLIAWDVYDDTGDELSLSRP